jgi:hypothetical protein
LFHALETPVVQGSRKRMKIWSQLKRRKHLYARR